MYRYNSNRLRAPARNPKAREMLKTILIVLLLIAVAFLSIRGIPAIRFQGDARALYLRRVQTECTRAMELSTTLSRTGGTNVGTVAKIRSAIYAMETVNDLSNATGAGYLVQEDWFTALYEDVEAYSNKTIAGMTTADEQTMLYNSLKVLNEQLQQIK